MHLQNRFKNFYVYVYRKLKLNSQTKLSVKTIFHEIYTARDRSTHELITISYAPPARRVMPEWAVSLEVKVGLHWKSCYGLRLYFNKNILLKSDCILLHFNAMSFWPTKAFNYCKKLNCIYKITVGISQLVIVIFPGKIYISKIFAFKKNLYKT